MGAPQFGPDDPWAPDVRGLLERHLGFSRSHGPPEDNHALEVADLDADEVSFFGIREDGALLAVGALRRIDGDHAEIKSMHTVGAARRRGIGRLMLQRLLEVAHAAGYRRVSLETGSMEAFAPARALYASAGFEECGPFAEYRHSPNSTYMTLDLD